MAHDTASKVASANTYGFASRDHEPPLKPAAQGVKMLPPALLNEPTVWHALAEGHEADDRLELVTPGGVTKNCPVRVALWGAQRLPLKDSTNGTVTPGNGLWPPWATQNVVDAHDMPRKKAGGNPAVSWRVKPEPVQLSARVFDEDEVNVSPVASQKPGDVHDTARNTPLSEGPRTVGCCVQAAPFQVKASGTSTAAPLLGPKEPIAMQSVADGQDTP